MRQEIILGITISYGKQNSEANETELLQELSKIEKEILCEIPKFHTRAMRRNFQI